MLSYQHGFHAGNRADVLKHAVLDALLRDLIARPAPILHVETHSGRALYDLTGTQSRKTGEADLGVLAFADTAPPKALKAWYDTIASDLPHAYPGSPALAARHLRKTDRLVLFERHPAEHTALTDALGKDPRCRIQKTDGYAGALKLAPRRGEQMLVVVDPSYETLRDMDELADWAPRALRRWPNATIALWLPLFRDEREAEFGAYLSELETGVISGARWPAELEKDTALIGSAMVVYRASDMVTRNATDIANSLQSLWAQ